MKNVGKFPSTRLRRVRNSNWIRRLVSENNLSANDLILPIFIREGRNKKESIKKLKVLTENKLYPSPLW